LTVSRNKSNQLTDDEHGDKAAKAASRFRVHISGFQFDEVMTLSSCKLWTMAAATNEVVPPLACWLNALIFAIVVSMVDITGGGEVSLEQNNIMIYNKINHSRHS